MNHLSDKGVSVDTLVEENRKWLEHSVKQSIPITHRMFVNESYYKSFWEYADHAIIIADKDKNIIEANPAFCELLGITPMEARKVNIFNLIPEFHCQTDFTNINAIISGDVYSFTSDSLVQKGINGDSKYIPVRIVATRVPSQLHENFQHIIIHIYLRGWQSSPISEGEILKSVSWSDAIK